MLKFRSFLRGFAWFLPPYSLCHLRGWTWALNTFVWAHCGSNSMPYAYWKFRSPHCQESQGAFGTAVKYCKAPLPAGGKSLEKGMPERLSGKLLHKGCLAKCQHFLCLLHKKKHKVFAKIKIFHSLGAYPERLLPNHPVFLSNISVLFKGKLLSFPGFCIIAMLINTGMYHRIYSWDEIEE